MKYLSLLLLLIFSFTCSGYSNLYSILPGLNGEVTLFNSTENTIYYWAVDRTRLASINYTVDRCSDSPDQIAVRKTQQLNLEEVFGHEPGNAMVLFWWVLGEKKANGCFKPACVSNVVLTPEMLLKSGSIINITGFMDCEPKIEI